MELNSSFSDKRVCTSYIIETWQRLLLVVLCVFSRSRSIYWEFPGHINGLSHTCASYDQQLPFYIASCGGPLDRLDSRTHLHRQFVAISKSLSEIQCSIKRSRCKWNSDIYIVYLQYLCCECGQVCFCQICTQIQQYYDFSQVLLRHCIDMDLFLHMRYFLLAFSFSTYFPWRVLEDLHGC